MGEGDGTVSLLSLGAMCVEGWKRKRWNPAGIKVTTVEVLLRRTEILRLEGFQILTGLYLSFLSSPSSYLTTPSQPSLVVEVTQQTTSTSSDPRP